MARGTPGPLDPIPGNTVIDIRNWGSTSTEESTTDAIDAALNAASGEGGGVVQLPPNAITTAGGHVIPEGVRVTGFGQVTAVTHTGNNACFSSHPGVLDNLSSVGNMRIIGNAGAAAIGVSWGDQWGFGLHELFVDDYTAGVGLQAQNTTHWTEGTWTRNVKVRNCATALEFTRSVTSPYDSFGYTDMTGLGINVPANGVGIKIGNSTGALNSLVYNSRLHSVFWLDDNGVAIQLTSNGTFTGELWVTGEMESGGTAGTLIDNDGSVLYVGNIMVYAGAIDTVFGGANPVLQRIAMSDSTIDAVTPVLSGGVEPGAQSHAGMGAVSAANQENLIVWGYNFGDNAVFQVAARPFAANTGDPWDATSEVAFEVLADGGINVTGNYVSMGNGCFWYSAAGSPEGVVTGPVGSLYTRTDGGATTTLYVKTSGTGNTGWTAK